MKNSRLYHVRCLVLSLLKRHDRRFRPYGYNSKLTLLAAVFVSVLLALPSKTQNRVDDLAAGDGNKFAIVTSSDSNEAFIIDLKTNSVKFTLPSGGVSTLGASMTPNGQLGIVANFLSGTLTFIDLKANPPAVIETLATAPLIPNPESIAITPNGKFGIVADGGSETDVLVIDLQQRVIVSSVSGLPGNQAAIVSRDGKLVLVLSAFANQVSVLNLNSKGILTDTGQRVTLSGAVGGPRSMAITPNGHIVLVTDTNGVVTILSIDGSMVSNVGSVTNLNQEASGVAITRDGKKAYISSFNTTLAVLSIGPGDSVTDTGRRIFVPDGTPTTFYGVPGLAITPNGQQLFIVGHTSGRVSILDTATDTLLPETISVGNLPAGIAMPGQP
jgi:YVTN family beta-propeller protein